MPITDPDRRALANLSIPRSVADLTHELRIDQHSQTWSESETNDALVDLASRGLAVKLNPLARASDVIIAAARHSDTIHIPDEKARIFERRRSRLSDTWKITGDTWMLSEQGLEALKEPIFDAPPFTTSQLKELIRAQWDAVYREGNYKGSIFDQGEHPLDPTAGGILFDPETGKPYEGNQGPSLNSSGVFWVNPLTGERRELAPLFEEEFKVWIGDVLKEHERQWGENEAQELRKALPVAGGTGWTDGYESTLVDAENQKSTITAAAPWFMCLSILAFTDTDTGTIADDGTHKPTYTGYARISVAAADMNSASAGSASNANALTGAACTAGSSVIVAFGNCSAATLATLRKYGTCSSTTVSTTQTPPQFAVGAYTTTAD